ncbi:MAG: hypothetical protein JST36_08740 [Bacteroidetes bacterium]|nr:hypothetical protein [Bacteroidota bacterium]
MKQFLLAIAMVAFTGTASMAQSARAAQLVPSDATLLAQKNEMISFTNKMETAVKNKNTDKIVANASEVLRLMKVHVRDTRMMAEAKGGEEGKKIYNRMLQLENRVMSYMTIIKDPAKNAAELVSQAKVFSNDF